MVVLRRVYKEKNRVCEDAHQDLLKSILRFFSSNPQSPTAWKEEWSVNPFYMADLGWYGAGNCMCGHRIRYQFQFINSVNHKTLPVGSECVKQLDLPKYSEALDKLERLAQMADAKVDPNKDAQSFVKEYKKMFSPDNIKVLADYGKINLDSGQDRMDYDYYKDKYKKRKFTEYDAEKFKDYILRIYDITKEFVNSIEHRSIPVTPNQINALGNDYEEKARAFSKAKQLSFNF